MKSRSAFVLILCFLPIQLGTVLESSCTAVTPEAAAHIGADETSYINIGEDSAAHKELIVFEEVKADKVSMLQNTLDTADKTIVKTEKLLNGHEMIKLNETQGISRKAIQQNIALASRGNYIERKTNLSDLEFNLSAEEFNLMAQVVEAEAGGEPYEGQIAVANVIFNRVKSGWGETVTDVINQKGQFTKRRKKPSKSVKDAVKEALSGKSAVPEGTLFFQNLDMSTDFTIPETREYVTKIGRHSFYK